MENVKYKLFIFSESENTSNSICAIRYDEQKEYYSFLREQIALGYKQVILSTEIIKVLLLSLVKDKEYRIDRIEFSEEDDEFDEEISDIIEICKRNSLYLLELLEKISFLSDDCSIEVSRAFLSKRTENGFEKIFIQSNGVISVTENHFDSVIKFISEEIERGFFG